MEDALMLENVHLEKIIVLNAMKKQIYAKNVRMTIFLMKMVDALILIIVKFQKEEYA